MKLSVFSITALVALICSSNAASLNQRQVLKQRHDNLPAITPNHQSSVLSSFDKRKCAVRVISSGQIKENVQAPAPAPVQVDKKWKKGVCVNNPSWVNYAPLKGHVAYLYNWSPWADAKFWDLGIESVPMLWGTKQVAEFNSQSSGYQSKGIKHILFLNEPEQRYQANMNPADAAALYWQTVYSKRNQFTIVGPALTASTENIRWQQDFMNRVGNLGPHVMATHYYGTNAQDFIRYLKQFHAAFPAYKIWITEYACHDFSKPNGCNDVWGFMGTMLEFFKNTDWIECAFPFSYQINLVGIDPRNALLKPDGSGLTPLGEFWANY